MVPAVSGQPAEPDLRTALEAAGYGQWLASGRLVVIPAGSQTADLVMVSRDALAVLLNYAHHLAGAFAMTTGPEQDLTNALATLDEEFSR